MYRSLLFIACLSVFLLYTRSTPLPRESTTVLGDTLRAPTQQTTVVYRYHRIDRVKDTVIITYPTPDRMMVMRYVYVKDRLQYIEVYDYAGETAENILDFEPKYYQLLVDGRTELQADMRSISARVN
ncbi:MAG: hypothetical protein WBQ23_10055 [Bacteroidota bacterium]